VMQWRRNAHTLLATIPRRFAIAEAEVDAGSDGARKLLLHRAASLALVLATLRDTLPLPLTQSDLAAVRDLVTADGTPAVPQTPSVSLGVRHTEARGALLQTGSAGAAVSSAAGEDLAANAPLAGGQLEAQNRRCVLQQIDTLLSLTHRLVEARRAGCSEARAAGGCSSGGGARCAGGGAMGGRNDTSSAACTTPAALAASSGGRAASAAATRPAGCRAPTVWATCIAPMVPLLTLGAESDAELEALVLGGAVVWGATGSIARVVSLCSLVLTTAP
jgi:hypothetical protein